MKKRIIVTDLQALLIQELVIQQRLDYMCNIPFVDDIREKEAMISDLAELDDVMKAIKNRIE